MDIDGAESRGVKSFLRDEFENFRMLRYRGLWESMQEF